MASKRVLTKYFSANWLQIELSKVSIQNTLLWNIETTSASEVVLSSHGRMLDVFVERKFELHIEHG